MEMELSSTVGIDLTFRDGPSVGSRTSRQELGQQLPTISELLRHSGERRLLNLRGMRRSLGSRHRSVPC